MTRILRALGTVLAVALLLGPVLGLAIGSTVDLGPSGEPGPTVVHWGLTLSDPFVASCLWNSVAATVAVVFPASVVGVVMARVVRGLGRRRRSIALVLLRLSAGIHPFFAAIGWVIVASLASGLAADRPESSMDEGRRWLLLGLAQFGFASAWVAWWTGRALDRIRADWLMIARLSGARRGWIWRTSVWPLVRPTVARASASVFAVLLIEPGAPIVLGLRRTLGFQVVSSCGMTSRTDFPRAATLAALALLIVVLVRLILLRWGGPDELPPADPSPTPGTASPHPPGPIAPAGRLRSAASAALLGGWLLLCLAPAAAILGSRALPGGRAMETGGPGLADPPLDVGDPRTTPRPPDRDLRAGSARGPIALPAGWAMAAGAAVVALAMAMAWPISASRRSRLAASAVETMPPLAIGVGLLGLSGLLGPMLAAATADPSLDATARWLVPYRSPWLLVTWGTAVAHLPWALASARRSRQIDAAALQDLARISGDRRSRSRTLLLAPIGLLGSLLPALGVLLVAAAGLSPAIVLTPLEPFRPIGPGVLPNPIAPIGFPSGLAALGLASQMLGVALLLRGDRATESVAILRG